MSRHNLCKTLGCTYRASADHAYCAQCRAMRVRARREGRDPDALNWKQLDAQYWRAA